MADTASEETPKVKCLGGDCDKDAGALQCPTCLKLGIKDSFFCSQECFKRNWVRQDLCALCLFFFSLTRSAATSYVILS